MFRQSKDLRRINNLEDRVFNQEMTTQSLIERAFDVRTVHSFCK